MSYTCVTASLLANTSTTYTLDGLGLEKEATKWARNKTILTQV